MNNDCQVKDGFSITYPETYPGTQKSRVNFYHEISDLKNIYEVQKDGKRRCFVTDSVIAELPCIKDFINSFTNNKNNFNILVVLGSGEKYKTIESVLTIVKTAVDADFSRNDIFVAIGGGVICDMTGFAASIFKRGAYAEFIPTTLLAMVDAAIGGKTGTDFDTYKNMIGSFFPAQKIDFFPEFIKYLPENEYRSGLAEVFKTALLYDKDLLKILKEKKQEIFSKDNEIIFDMIYRCAKAKANVVEKDFTEKNIRMYLNLGHTFAHALETVAGLGTISHGDAVAWGIGRAAEFSLKKGFCSNSYKDEIFSILKTYGWQTSSLPIINGKKPNSEKLIEAMHKDKKNNLNKIKLVLQKEIGNTFTQEFDDRDILTVLK